MIFFIVYQKGDLVKQPMKSRDVLPKNVPVGWGEDGHKNTTRFLPL